MEELKIVEVKEFNEFVLESRTGRYNFTIEFYDMPKPKVGDVLILSENCLDTKSPDFVSMLQFEVLDEKNIKKFKESDIMALHTKNKDYILHRIYLLN